MRDQLPIFSATSSTEQGKHHHADLGDPPEHVAEWFNNNAGSTKTAKRDALCGCRPHQIRRNANKVQWAKDNIRSAHQKFQHSHGIHVAAIYGVPWIPSIYPLYVSINIPAPLGSVMGLMGNLTWRKRRKGVTPRYHRWNPKDSRYTCDVSSSLQRMENARVRWLVVSNICYFP